MGAEVCTHRAGDKHLAPRGEARWWDLGGRRGDHASEARRQQHMYWTTASRTSPRRTVNERWTHYGAAGQSSRGNVARRQRRPLFTFAFAPNLSRQRHPSLLRAPEPDLYTTAAVESFRLLALSEFLSIKPWHTYELVCESFGTAFRFRSPNYAVFAELWSDSGVTKQPCFLVGTQCRQCPEPVLPPRMRHEHPLHDRKAAPFRMATRRTHRWPHPSSEGSTFCTRVIRVR